MIGKLKIGFLIIGKLNFRKPILSFLIFGFLDLG